MVNTGSSAIIGSWKIMATLVPRTWRRPASSIACDLVAGYADASLEAGAAGGNRRIRARNVTLLPEPDSPRMASTLPASTPKLTPLTAATDASRPTKRTFRSSTETTCATLEFLKAIDYDFPQWATELMERVESALGDADWSTAGDGCGFAASVKLRVAVVTDSTPYLPPRASRALGDPRRSASTSAGTGTCGPSTTTRTSTRSTRG